MSVPIRRHLWSGTRLTRYALDVVGNVFLGLAALCVVLIVVLLTYSSLRRYILGSPIAETEELSALLFMAMAFLAIVPGFLRGRQIRLLVFSARLPERQRPVARLIGDAASVAALALVVRECWAFAAFSREIGARSEIAGLLLWPWMLIIPAALAILSLAIAVETIAGWGDPDRTTGQPADARPPVP